MLTYTDTNYRPLNPLDFDLRALGRASNLLLGKAKTDMLLNQRGPKASLMLVGALEAEAEAVRRFPKKPLPEDASPKNEDARRVLIDEIQQWKQLHLNGTQETQLPYRLRGANQLRAVLDNRVSIQKNDKGTTADIVVSLKDLKKTVDAAEATGRCTIEIDLPTEDAEYVRNTIGEANVTLQFQDELSERPETKRAWLGNIAHRCEERAKAEGTLPQDELEKIARSFSGRRINLAKEGKVTGARMEVNGDRSILHLDLTLPEIEKKIADAGPNEKNPGVGSICDGALTLHAANQHGCNGRDFVKVSADLTKTLVTNAVEAAKTWLKKDGGMELLAEFTRDYAAVALTMRPRMRPVSKLEPARSRLARPEDLTPSQGNPEEVYALEGIADIDSAGFSCPASTGGEWLDGLARTELGSWDDDYSKGYAAALEAKFGISKTIEKSLVIHKNFLGVDQPLDGGPKQIKIDAPSLTDDLDDEFNEEKERHDQATFDSKAEGDTLNKAEWLDDKGHVSLELPANGPFLHRLKRYKNRPNQLGLNKSKAEQMDKEIRMPKAVNAKWESRRLKLSDFLTEAGKKELEELRMTGSDFETRNIDEIDSLIESWQSSLRPLDPLGKNPLEGKARLWMEAVANNKESELCSLSELVTVFSPSLKNAGKVPYDTEKTPRDLGMPARSNPLPLQLLCGDSTKSITKLAEAPEKLWDMVMRWQCASVLHEEPLPEREETRVHAMEEAFKADTPAAILGHAVAMELAEKPDTLGAYLEDIGMPYGISSLPGELMDMADICTAKGKSVSRPGIHRAPNTGTFKGEETSLDDLAELLETSGIDLNPTEIEKLQIQQATPNAIKAWQSKVVESLQLLGATEQPSGKKAEVTIMLTPEERGDVEIDPFDITLDVLGKEMPKSKTDVGDIASALLIHAPKTLEINTGTETVSLQKGSGSTWVSKNPTALSKQLAEKVSRVERMIAGNEPTITEDETVALAAAAGKAHGARIATNVDKIQPALQSLPPILASRPKIREITEPLGILSGQLQAAIQAKVLADRILGEWNETADGSPWGWEGEVDLNPAGTIEYTCRKIMGEEENPGERERNYLVRGLINEQEKATAIEILKRDGKKPAAFFLTTAIEKNMASIEKTAQENMPELVNTLRDRLTQMIGISQSPEIRAAIENGPLGKFLQDTAKYRALETKIRTKATELAKTLGTSKTMEPSNDGAREVVTHEQKGRDIIPGNGAAASIIIAVDPDTNKVTTNKAWANGWLKTNRGAENLQKRLNTLGWIKASVDASLKPQGKDGAVKPTLNAKTALAFLTFCSHRMLPVSDAIADGNLTAQDRKELQTGLERFSGAIKALGIDPEKHQLRTMLVAATALSQYCSAKFPRNNPWKKEWEAGLEKIEAKGIGKVTTPNLEFSTAPTPMVRIESPFKPEMPTDTHALETSKKKVLSATRAANSLYRTL